jgi:hypothetical protein
MNTTSRPSVLTTNLMVRPVTDVARKDTHFKGQKMFVKNLVGLDIIVAKEITVDENDISHETIVASVVMQPDVIRVTAQSDDSFLEFWERVGKAVFDLGKVKKNAHSTKAS